MKTSNYITISFFVCLFGGIFALFLAAKIDPRGSTSHEMLTQEKTLDNFSVVVAKPGANIRLSSGETSKMVLNYSKEDTCTFPAFTVKNDTLFVDSNPPHNKYHPTEIFVNQIICIEGKDKSHIQVDQFYCDSLLVKMNNGEFRFSKQSNSAGFSLCVEAIGSNIQIGEVHITNLDFQLNKSQMNIWRSKVAILSGKLNESSDLTLEGGSKINIEADSTSTYRLNN